MCDCLKNIRENIKINDDSITGVSFVLDNIRTINNGKFEGLYRTGQALDIEYKYTKRDGAVIRKNRKSFVGHDFCPWCGVKYE